MLTKKNIAIGMVSLTLLVASIGIIGWIVKKEIDEKRGEHQSVSDVVPERSNGRGQSKLPESLSTEGTVRFETKDDARKALDSMDQTMAGLEEDIE